MTMSGEQTNMGPCRKCGVPNPMTNQYCASCGAVLQVSTALVEAQPKPIHPFVATFSKRVALLAVAVMIGCGSISLAVGFGVVQLLGLGQMIWWVAAAGAPVGLFFGGVALTVVSGQRRVVEALFGALLAALLCGLAARAFSNDFVWVMLLLALPGMGAAGLGAWLGGRARRHS